MTLAWVTICPGHRDEGLPLLSPPPEDGRLDLGEGGAAGEAHGDFELGTEDVQHVGDADGAAGAGLQPPGSSGFPFVWKTLS